MLTRHHHRYTVRSGQSVYSNNNSQYGGSERGSSISAAGRGLADAGEARRAASWSTKARAHPLPRGLRVHRNGDFGEGGGRGEMDDDGGYCGDDSGYGGGVAALGGSAGAEWTNGGTAGHHRSSGRRGGKAASDTSHRRRHGHGHGSVVSPPLDDGGDHTRATGRTDGSVSDVGCLGGTGNRRINSNNPRSGSRTMLRTMSLRGRSFFFAGGGGGGGSASARGLGERRSVSLSSFRGRGESARSAGGDGGYDSAGGGRGVANRVCSALSVSWLFSRRRSSRKDATETTFKRRGGNSKSSRSSRGSGGGGSRRTTTAFSGGGVVGVVDAGADGSSSDEADYDGDVFEIGGPLDIAVGGGGAGGRRSYGSSAVSRVVGGVDDYGGGGGSSLPSYDGASPGGGSSIGTGASGSLHGSKRISFSRSAFLGFNRNAHRWVFFCGYTTDGAATLE